MERLMEWLMENFALVATIVAFAAAFLLTGKRRAYFEWANEILFLAFDNAEKRGILDGWSGADKLRHYLGIWRQAYLERFGKEPGEEEMQFAINKAAELAIKEKRIKATVEELANPKS